MWYWIAIVSAVVFGVLVGMFGMALLVIAASAERAALEADKIKRLKKQIDKVERKEIGVSIQRDLLREFVDEIAELLGCKEQYSSSYHDHHDCIRNAVKRLR